MFTTLAADPTLACERIAWDLLDVTELLRKGRDLIVAVADPAPPTATFVFEWLARNAPGAPLVAILPGDSEDEWLRLATTLADDFLFSPVRPLELRARLQRMLPMARHGVDDVGERLHEEMGLSKLVGKNAAFLHAIRLLPRFARADATVLITGETGTGKELCARAIHHLSERRSFPFIAVDCGAIPDQLFENELFGHSRGAFTDAHREQKGLIAIAEGGTLFLDEVDALSLPAQAKLLRFLQERTFRALGSERMDRADVKIIVATNKDLQDCVQNKELRADLFFRLNILRIHLPPLRDRRDDVPLLASSMLAEARGSGPGPKSFSTAALRMLSLYDWPGNVRELFNIVQRALVECDGDVILPEHVSVQSAAPPEKEPLHFRAARAAAVAQFERQYVEDLLRKHGGNVSHAAREAKQDRRAFGRVIKKHKINRLAL